MAENVRVVVRCRPMSYKENVLKCKDVVGFENGIVNLYNPSDKLAPSKSFKFDNTYDGNSATESLYNDICYALVENVLEGYNGTIFAYGQTGCGKSHTMQGHLNPIIPGPDDLTLGATLKLSETNNFDNTNKDFGIIPRSFDHIFEAISVASEKRYLVLVSYLEIYNETIRDLLQSIPTSSSSVLNTPGTPSSSSGLHLKEIPGEGIIVTNLTTHTAHTARECEELLKIGIKNRITGSTLMNANSSRSHSIFTISLEQIDTEIVDQINDININTNNLKAAQTETRTTIKKGKLNLVDLAGSERQNKTGAIGDRLKEATKINLSLSALGNVISALVDGKTKHIPYRDSKLTRLLQDSLGGNTKTLMIACISPADYNYDETLSTLRYANRAKNIHNKPKINEDPKDAKLRQYQEEINKLRKLLEENQFDETKDKNNGFKFISIDDPNNILTDIEKQNIKTKYEMEADRLRQEYELQQKEKEEILHDMELLKEHYINTLRDFQNNNDGEINNNDIHLLNLNFNNSNSNDMLSDIATTIEATTTALLNKKRANANEITQQEALNRIEIIKNALIGGERSNDIELKEKRNKKKIAAQRRLSALAHALSRVEQTSDRDLLQEHYTDIQQELKIKNESLKASRQQIKALEREVTDLQSEFQLDRADYLETIRRLQKNLKFYQQLLEKASPILRKDGKYWDPDKIQHDSVWNDDLKVWKLPEHSMTHLKLPPAELTLKSNQSMDATKPNDDVDDYNDENSDDVDICKSYFRRKKTAPKKNSKSWKDITKKNLKHLQENGSIATNLLDYNNNNNKNNDNNSVLASWLPSNRISLSKIWYDLSKLSVKSAQTSSTNKKNLNYNNYNYNSLNNMPLHLTIPRIDNTENNNDYNNTNANSSLHDLKNKRIDSWKFNMNQYTTPTNDKIQLNIDIFDGEKLLEHHNIVDFLKAKKNSAKKT